MDLAKDNWLLTVLLRKKTRCVQLWLNSYQADLQRGEALTELLLDLLVTASIPCCYTQGIHNIPCAKLFTRPRTLHPGKKPAAFLLGLGTWRNTLSLLWLNRQTHLVCHLLQEYGAFWNHVDSVFQVLLVLSGYLICLCAPPHLTTHQWL